MNLPTEASALSRRSFVKLLGATTSAAGLTATLAACGTPEQDPTAGATRYLLGSPDGRGSGHQARHDLLPLS